MACGLLSPPQSLSSECVCVSVRCEVYYLLATGWLKSGEVVTRFMLVIASHHLLVQSSGNESYRTIRCMSAEVSA
eukprot:383135-Amphidinium_carterae.1